MVCRDEELGDAFACHLADCQGLLAFINIPIANIGAILAALAIATGVLLLMGR